MDKNLVISELLIQIQEKNPGMQFRDIFDFILGPGAYEKLASDVYDKLRGVK